MNDYRNKPDLNIVKSILLIDSNPVTLSILQKIFKPNQFKIIVANEVMEASSILEDIAFDIIFIASQLSFIEGRELCVLLKEILPKNIEVIEIENEKNNLETIHLFESVKVRMENELSSNKT